MHTMRESITLNLNYAHKSLSVFFRIIAGIIGLSLIGVGLCGFTCDDNLSKINSLSYIINIIFGVACLGTVSKYLPNVARRYIKIGELSLRYKLNVFLPQQKFLWNKVEEIEIDRTMMKVRLENEIKPRAILLGSVSYNDFEKLQKAIVEICLDKEIDIK